MSNLLEQASLVMIPSGYKEDIVYSVIPTSGAGDLTFTRASNGTRIDSDGNVEVVPWNLLQYSEQFTNAIWTPKSGTFTDNFATAPNGTQTAAKWQATNSDPYIYQAFNGQNIDYTVTCWVKATGTAIGKNCSIRIAGNAVFVAMTGEWQQLTITGNINGSVNVGVEAPESATIGEIVYIWGFQVNIGSTAKPYFPTTDRLNVPRLTYQNGGGGCPSLLLEKQSTNLATYSEQLDNAAWTKIGSTISSNVVTSPDGTQDADKIAEDNSTQLHYVSQGGYMGSAGAYSASIYLKAAERTWAFVYIYNGTDPAGTLAFFNLSNGTIGTVDPAMTASVTDVGNGWYRCIINRTIAGNAAAGWGFGTSTGNGNSSFTGTTGSGIYAWGAQCELSSYSTSYIPTTSSSATRVADACYKTGISSLIGQTEGVIYIEAQKDYNNGDDVGWGALLNGVNDFIYIFSLGNTLYCNVYVSSTPQVSLTYSLTNGDAKKIAFAYKQNDFALYVNGAQIATDTSGTVPTCNEFTVSSSHFGLTCGTTTKEILLFPTRLTNSELAQLTGNQNYTINQAYESYGVASESPNCVQP